MALALSLSVPLVSVAAEGSGNDHSISRFASALGTRLAQETGIFGVPKGVTSTNDSYMFMKELDKGLLLLRQGHFGEAEAAFLSAWKVAPSDQRGHLDAAIGTYYMEANRFDDACRWAEKSITDEPDFWLPHTILGILYSGKDHQDLPKAMDYLREAIRLSPETISNYQLLGTLQAASGDPTGAIDTCTKCIALDPSDYFSYMIRGCTYEDLKDYEKALADFRRALSMDLPDKYRTKTEIEEAEILFHLSRYDESLAIYEKVLARDSGNYRATYMTGLIYKAKKQYDTALPWLEKASGLKPEASKPYDVMGFIYTKQKKDDLARENLQKAVDRKSTMMRTYRLLALLDRESGKDDEALKVLDLAVTRLPRDPEARSERGWFFFTKKEYTRGIDDFTKAIELGSKSKAKYLAFRGLCYHGLEEYKKAEADYQEAIRLNPNNDLAYIGLGDIYIKGGDYDRAIEFYNKALSISKGSKRIILLNNLGFAYAKKGEYKKSLEILNEGIQNYPNDAEIWRSRAQTYDAMGQPEKGIPDMDEFLKRKPGDARGYRFRATLYEKTGKKDLAEKDREKAEALEKGGKQS